MEIFAWRLSRLIFAAFLFTGPLFATCRAVGPVATGSGSGLDWSDQMAAPSGTNWVRGYVYYLADGLLSNSLSITTAASGTSVIELRKAQSYDYGRSSDGCTNDISAGWNASTMGSAQAIIRWASAGAIMNLGSGGYITINGNGQNAGTTEVGCGGVNASPPAAMTNYLGGHACGILIDDSTCTATTFSGCDAAGGVIRGDGPDIIFESTEWFGQGLNSLSSNQSETYFWFASGGTLTDVKMTHNYIHNISTVAFVSVNGGWNSSGSCTASFDHNYHWGEFDSTASHGESVQWQGVNTGACVHHNIWRDQITNGDVVGTDTGGNASTFYIYDNADFCSPSYSCTHNDGDIGSFGTGIVTAYVYNNTWATANATCGFNVGGGSGSVASTIIYENNLNYGCGGFDKINGSSGTTTIDYNSYLNSGQSAIGAHDISATGVSNPFVSTISVQLTADSSHYNNRLSLGSPYDTLDLYGNAFTTDRGAAQFVNASSTSSAAGVKKMIGVTFQ